MVSPLACDGLLGSVCEGAPVSMCPHILFLWWILSQVFSRDFQLFFSMHLLSSPCSNLFIHIKCFLSKVFSIRSSRKLLLYYCCYLKINSSSILYHHYFQSHGVVIALQENLLWSSRNRASYWYFQCYEEVEGLSVPGYSVILHICIFCSLSY